MRLLLTFTTAFLFAALYTAKKYHNKRVQGIKLHICQGSTMHKLQPSSYPKYAEGKTKSNREQD